MSQLAKLLIASALLSAAAASIAQSTDTTHSMTAPIGSAANAATVVPPIVNPNAAGMPSDRGAAAGMSSSSGASATSGTSGTSGTSATGATAASTSADPYVQKREADSVAKKEYKAKKKIAKAEYKQEKASAKSDMKMEKRESTAERNSAITADPAMTAMPGQQNNLGK